MKFIVYLANTLVILVLNSVMKVYSSCVENRTSASSYPVGSNIFNGSLSDECECKKRTCVRKCCDLNYYLDNEACVYNDSLSLKVPLFEYGTVKIEKDVDVRFIYGGLKCKYQGNEEVKMRKLRKCYIQKDGRMWFPEMHISLKHKRYCVDNTNDGPFTFYCIPHGALLSTTLSSRLNFLGMAISLPFLLVTFIIYAILPLKNLHGMSLMSYVLALFATYVLHVFDYLYNEKYDPVVCRILAMLIIYFFVASFFWMNVMSYDIWWTFSGFVNLRTMAQKSFSKYFLFYSMYAWGCPLLLIGLLLGISGNIKPNTWYDPGLTENRCYLNDGIPTLLYYYGPITVLLIANTVLFATTACKIRQVQQDTVMLQEGDNKTSHKDNKERFYLYLKLYLAMGVNWSMEVISYVISWQFSSIPRSVWYLTDFCNAAFGVIIFFVFVFKRNVWKLLKKRYQIVKKKLNVSRSALTERSLTG